MTKPLKLIKIGNSTGIILPKDMLARLNVELGDELFLNEGTDGGYKLSPYNPEFATLMDKAEQIMREDRDILRVLAK